MDRLPGRRKKMKEKGSPVFNLLSAKERELQRAFFRETLWQRGKGQEIVVVFRVENKVYT